MKSSHASVLSNYSKINIINGEIQEISTAEDGLRHTITVDLFDVKKPASIGILMVLLPRRPMEFRMKTVLMVKPIH